MSKVRYQETGSALLSVLLVVALMSVTALAMMDVTMASIRQAKVVDQRSRLTWQIVGAEQAGRVGVARLAQTSNGALYEGIVGLANEFVAVADDAQIVGRIEDASNCFNLNALFGGEETDQQQTLAEANFRLLLIASGIPESDADRLTDALLDWMDRDNTQRSGGAEDSYYTNLPASYLTAGTRLAEISELRAIRGYNRAVTEHLTGLLCVRPDTDMSVININTLKPEQSELLSMALSGELSTDTVRDIILARPLGGWRSVEDMFADDKIQRIAPDLRQPNLLSTRSNYLSVEGRIAGLDRETRFSIIYAIGENSAPQIVSRSVGERS